MNLKMKLISLYRHYVKRAIHKMIMFLVKQLLLSIRKLLLLVHHLNQVLPYHQSFPFRFPLQLTKRCLPLPQSLQLEFLLQPIPAPHLNFMKVNNEIRVSTADQIYRIHTTTWGPQIAQYLLQRNKTARQKRISKEEFAMAVHQTEPMAQYSLHKI